MALGGGTFTVQNKVLPGAYINFVSAAKASSTLSDRGVVAAPFFMDWGDIENIVKVENGDFEKNSLKLTGYGYTSDKLKYFREAFKNAKTLYMYRINGTGGVKASCELATAKYEGIRGNNIKITVAKNVDDETKFDVKTYIDDTLTDTQTVLNSGELASNDFVEFKTGTELSASAGISLSGGENGTNTAGQNYQTFLDKIERYNFNTLACPSTEEAVKGLFAAFTKRMRDEVGAKFQTIIYKAENADNEGIISLENKAEEDNEAGLVYWTAGVQAACAVNKSNTNKVYNGELKVNVKYTQSQLEDCIKSGKFVMHEVNDEIRILRDINSFISFSDVKREDFSSNQTIRVLDQIANDIAVLFNTKYLGNVANDKAGQISLWNDIVSYNNQLQTIRAIENFVSDDVTVEQGNDKKTVVVNNAITPVNAMEKLYMSVIVR